MDKMIEKRLEIIANTVRKDVVRMTGIARSGHLASSLSIVDILTVLYWNIMEVSPEEPNLVSRDRFVLSKGHGCPALYAVLSHRGFFSREELWNYRRLGAMLQGHPETPRTPGIDSPSGSLGMGIGVANGMALFLKRNGFSSRVFCLAGDGELQEGSLWESLMMASHYKLGNLVLIVDRNMQQSEGRISDIMEIEPLDRKFEAFGWDTVTVDGHDMSALDSVMSSVSAEKPVAVIAKTIAGKGVSFIESSASGPERTELTRDLMDQALRELNSQFENREDS